MHRRRLLATIGSGAALLAGCTGTRSGDTPPADTPTAAQSGSGHPCESPRHIDYDAVETYRSGGVYLESDADAVHTACMTVTRASTGTEEGGGEPPPLDSRGYEMHPGNAVEVFAFREPGTYTIAVEVDGTTARETVEWMAEDAGMVTVTIEGPETIRFDRRDSLASATPTP